MSRLRTHLDERPMVVALVTLVIGLGVGMAVGLLGSSSTDDTDLQAELAAAERSLDISRDGFLAQKDKIKDAKREAAQAREGARRDAEALAGDQRDLAKEQAALDARANELNQAEQTLETSSIPDGVWKIGTDFEPGLYRAPGGGSCYWAELGSADPNDIVGNGFAGKNQTVQIDAAFFETNGCGEWVKIG